MIFESGHKLAIDSGELKRWDIVLIFLQKTSNLFYQKLNVNHSILESLRIVCAGPWNFALNKAIVLIDKKYIRANKQQKYKKNINEGCISTE